MSNETCPITLEPLSEIEHVFVHENVGFDLVALYEYLVQAPQLINPVNRQRFERRDLIGLEQRMEVIFGEGCILVTEEDDDTDTDDDVDSDVGEDGRPTVDGDDMHMHAPAALLDEAEIISRINTSILNVASESNARLIRLQVDLDISDLPLPLPNRPATPSPSMSTHSSSSSTAIDIDPNDLPPRRTFPSVVQMLEDRGRTQRMADRMSLIAYLEYDALAVLHQMLDLGTDARYHRFVWNHTSLDVMDAVTTYLDRSNERTPDPDALVAITEPSPQSVSQGDYDIEVVYTSVWEVYRSMILTDLQERYVEAVRDIRNLSVNDYRALVASHRHLVEQRGTELHIQFDDLMHFLQNLP